MKKALIALAIALVVPAHGDAQFFKKLGKVLEGVGGAAVEVLSNIQSNDNSAKKQNETTKTTTSDEGTTPTLKFSSEVGKGDLPLHLLTGNVYSCIWSNDRGLYVPVYNDPYDGNISIDTLKFTKAGRLATYNGKKAMDNNGSVLLFSSYERNAKGQLVNASMHWSIYTPMSSSMSWEYDDNGRLSKAVHEDPNATLTRTFVYDEQGLLTKISMRLEFDFSDYDSETLKEWGLDKEKNRTMIISYKYLEADEQGNWTKRSATTNEGGAWTETRQIKYYQ